MEMWGQKYEKWSKEKPTFFSYLHCSNINGQNYIILKAFFIVKYALQLSSSFIWFILEL